MPKINDCIRRGDALDAVFHQFCASSDETEAALNAAIEEINAIKAVETVDMRYVVHCRDCIYWQRPQIKLDDGSYIDYDVENYESLLGVEMVTIDVGVNMDSICQRYDRFHANPYPYFVQADDFCSHGYKKEVSSNDKP